MMTINSRGRTCRLVIVVVCQAFSKCFCQLNSFPLPSLQTSFRKLYYHKQLSALVKVLQMYWQTQSIPQKKDFFLPQTPHFMRGAKLRKSSGLVRSTLIQLQNSIYYFRDLQRKQAHSENHSSLYILFTHSHFSL